MIAMTKLTGGMASGHARGDFKITTVTDAKTHTGVDTDAMDILLHSTETSEVDILRSANVLSVLQASCMLQFEAVKRSCIDLIMNKWLCVDSCLQIIHTAQKLDLHDLHNKAIALALWEFSQVKKTSSFFHLSILDLEAYLQDDGLNVRHGEFEVFDAGITWVEDDVGERAQFLMRVIQCVRFDDVESHDIQTMLLYPLVTENVEVVQLLKCICDVKSTASKDCQSISDDCNLSVRFEDDSLLERSKDSAELPSTKNAMGCYERLCQCTYFSGASIEASRNLPVDGGHVACIDFCCSHSEGSQSSDQVETDVPSCQPHSESHGQHCWDTATVNAASRLLQQPPRWWPVLPCVVCHTVEEIQDASLPPGKPFVFSYDENKGDVFPVMQLAKINDGPVELSGAGAAVVERLVRSPPIKVNRVQSPAWSPDFRMWESCWMMSLVGGISWGSPVSPGLSFRESALQKHFFAPSEYGKPHGQVCRQYWRQDTGNSKKLTVPQNTSNSMLLACTAHQNPQKTIASSPSLN
ncbi:hypothetical protein PR048_001817 [Dryococelus australis]|uniref:BACK domain-containing protein n=1 Tax=Dryococelus australis TaxID=614101 RepID=A0ABQ9IIE9_9NEOP|nr:hypothetical protein PR048_001817 [Dryococelus australis]